MSMRQIFVLLNASYFITFFFIITLSLRAYDGEYNHFCGSLDQELSNITEIISFISNLDDNQNTPLCELKQYLENNPSYTDYEIVLCGLSYAIQLLEEK